MRAPFTLGPLPLQDALVKRSGVQWLYAPGYRARANEVVGYFNISVEALKSSKANQTLFANEKILQLAIAPRIDCQVWPASRLAIGGALDQRGAYAWEPGDQIAELEPCDDLPLETASFEAAPLLLAAQRKTMIADVTEGLLPGWHQRTRAWWGDGRSLGPTVLSLGICDVYGPIRGAKAGFFEMFQAAETPGQVVDVPNHPLVPCAPCLLEQFNRTPKEAIALTQALLSELLAMAEALTPEDLFFLAGLTSALSASPLSDEYELATPDGLKQAGPAGFVVLSLNAEAPTIRRHRRLGFHVHILRFHLPPFGSATRRWLDTAFEAVQRGPQSIQDDYARLFDTVHKKTGAQFMIANRMSTSGSEDINNYAAFDLPLSATLSNVASKALNIAVEELAQRPYVHVIDVDAMAAAWGGHRHLPDGVHQSGVLETAIRLEIMRTAGLLL